MSSKFFILVGPSGVGKSTLMQKLLEKGFPIAQLVTYTTRPKRSYEVDKKDYFFLTNEEFNQKAQLGEILLPDKVYNNQYGMPKKFIEDHLKTSHIIAAISHDVAQKVQNYYGSQDIVTIYICPPSIEELFNRLQSRNTENKTTLESRIALAEQELRRQNSCDYKIINDELEKAVTELENICKNNSFF